MLHYKHKRANESQINILLQEIRTENPIEKRTSSGSTGDQIRAIGNTNMTQRVRGARTAIQTSTNPAGSTGKVQGNNEGKKAGGDGEKPKGRFVPCLQEQITHNHLAWVSLHNCSTSHTLYIEYFLYSSMTEDSATVDSINKTALGREAGAASNVQENCRGLMQKCQLIPSGSSGSSTPNPGRRIIT